MTQTLTVQSELAELDAPATSDGRRVDLARPLLGFPASRTFELARLGERYAPFLAFNSLDEPGLGFIVVAPGALFRDYVFEVGEGDVELLGLHGADEIEVLVLVSRHPGTTPTVNLMGPIVINRQRDLATQVVLQDDDYGAAVPVDAPSAHRRAPA